jgi:GxxExxY protein
MGIGDVLDDHTERMATQIVDAIFRVHTTFGPGLLESIYEQCLALELESRGLRVERQVLVPLFYNGKSIDPGLRLDLLVEGRIIIECKAVEKMNPVYFAQTKTYLKLANKRLAFLVNFNVNVIKDSIQRIIL